jgi:hypothetical protein
MAITQNTFTGNGSNLGPFSFTFKWLESTDIKVTVAGVLKTVGTHYNLQGLNYATKSGGQVLFTAGNAPANGAAIVIYRQTNDADLVSTFYSGSAIRAQDLNDNFTQGLYVTQEANNNVITANATANTALTTANTALSNSNTAISTANTASTNASAAVVTANAASASASAAVSTANTASSNATAAVNTANTASANATAAVNTANATSAAQTALAASVYTKTELNAGQLDNRYYTESELNAGQLDNRYYTETEADTRFYNVNTESIKSTDVWTNSDGFVATTAAIEARVITLVDEVGGFVPISSHTQFPTSNPDINNNAGTVVSIANVSGLTHSGGTSTNARTTGSTAVTITGIPGSLPSPATATGMLVVTTGTLNSYTFHRLTPEVNDVVNVANNATNINTVAGQISPTNNVGTVAGIAGSVSTVAGNNSNVTTVATNIASVNTNTANIANINTVAGISGNVSTVAGVAANVTTVAGNTANINTVAGISGNVTTVAGNNANVTTVANNTANITSCATNIVDIQNAVTSAANAATSASAAATSASNASGSATAAAGSASAAATSAANALVSEQNADASEALALQYRDDTASILAQADSDAYNVSTNQSWGDIITGAANRFANEVLADILLTMSKGTNSYNYGTL